MDSQEIHQIVATSGGILYVMAILLLAGLTVAIERLMYLHRTASRGARLLDRVRKMKTVEPGTCRALEKEFPDLPHVDLIRVAGTHPEEMGSERLMNIMEEMILWRARAIDRNLWVLDTIVTLAPLLGLLGTIIGMFNTFHVLAASAGAPSGVSGGVAEALVSTALGLVIAILGLIAYNGLQDKVRGLAHQLETLKMALGNRADGQVRVAQWRVPNVAAREHERTQLVGAEA